MYIGPMLIQVSVTCYWGHEIKHQELEYERYELSDSSQVKELIAEVKEFVKNEFLPHYDRIECLVCENRLADYGHDSVTYKRFVFQRTQYRFERDHKMSAD